MKKSIQIFMICIMAVLLIFPAASCGKKEEPQVKAIPIEKVVTDRMEMNYFRFGSGEKIMVILPGLSVQSVMGSADAVAEAYSCFADDFTVYLFDRREDLPDIYSIEDMAEDTIEAMKALGLDDVYLFGASQGGMIALSIAIKAPSLVCRLALGSTCASAEDIQTGVLTEWIDLASSGDREALQLAFGRALYPEEVYSAYEDVFREMAKGITDGDLERFVILAKGIGGFDVTGELNKISCPVLAIGSNDDMVLGPEGTLRIAQILKDKKDFSLYMYDGYGHASFDTAPDYKERLMEFFLGETP